jgi:hypothetical protein
MEVVHNIRDVTYREDASRVRTGYRPRIIATLRNLTISLIRLSNWNSKPAAHEHYRDNKRDALALLGLTSREQRGPATEPKTRQSCNPPKDITATFRSFDVEAAGLQVRMNRGRARLVKIESSTWRIHCGQR